MARINLCSRYEECSRQWKCVNNNTELRETCSYGKHLKNGINFYNKEVRNRTYIEIYNRLFYVGVMNHKSSRSPNEEQRGILNEAALVLSEYEFGKLVVDEGSEYKEYEDLEIYQEIEDAALDQLVVDQGTETEWCNCLVTFHINNIRFVIWNFNIRALKKETAIKIRDWFRSKEIESAVVTLGKPPQRKNIVKTKPAKSTPKKEVVGEPFIVKENLKGSYNNLEQVDMFGLIGSSK